MPVRAHVKNGRLLVDEPTDLPDGTELSLVAAAPVKARLAPIDVVGDRVGCADSGRSDLSARASPLVKERVRARHARSR